MKIWTFENGVKQNKFCQINHCGLLISDNDILFQVFL